jgi:hypothetical protein
VIARVPVDAPVHIYEPGTLPFPLNLSGSVKVTLRRDKDLIGHVTFSHTASQINGRATEATFLLSGAYVQVTGEAEFDVANEVLLREVMAEVSGD